MTEKVIIASQNPVKINAVKIGFRKMFPGKEFEFVGISVSSGVSNQPMSSNETLKGALNRAENAMREVPNAKFWIGIEGGIEKLENEMKAFAWIIVKSAQKIGKAQTGSFFLPKKIVSLINQGMELGEADDIVFGSTNSKQQNGAVGILTKNVIDRTKYYSDAIILSLIPFKNPNLY